VIKLTMDKEHVATILKGLLRNYEKHGDFYCPCKLKKTQENICPCEEFRKGGDCHCELWDRE
jgi:ferredoxin-thioredoxin reductase catalytic subunit